MVVVVVVSGRVKEWMARTRATFGPLFIFVHCGCFKTSTSPTSDIKRAMQKHNCMYQRFLGFIHAQKVCYNQYDDKWRWLWRS